MARPEEGLKKLMFELLSWESYSSFQKLVVLFFVSCVLSLCSSLWTVVCIFSLSLLAGFKFSEHILHHDKTSVIAEQILDKIESIYLYVSSYISKGRKIINDVATGKHGISSSLEGDADVKNDTPDQIEDKHVIYHSGSAIPVNLSSNVGQELNSIQLLILRDFIRSWYADYSYDSQFLKDTKLLLQQTFNNFVSRIAQQEAKCVITQVVKLFNVHVANYQKARNSLQSHKIHPNTNVATGATIKRHISIDEAFESLIPFHCALESEQLEMEYLKGVMSVFVVCTCSSNVIKGVGSRTLLVDILSNNIMLPLMQMMSKPDWLMEMVIRVTSPEEETAACSNNPEQDTHSNESLESDAVKHEDDAVVNNSENGDNCPCENFAGKELDIPELAYSDTFHTCDEPAEGTVIEDWCEKSREENADSKGKEIGDELLRNADSHIEGLEHFSSDGEKCDTVMKPSLTENTDKDDDDDEKNIEERKVQEGAGSCVQNHLFVETSSETASDIDKDSSSLNSLELEQPNLKSVRSNSLSADYFVIDKLDVDPQKIISFMSSTSAESDDIGLLRTTSDPVTGGLERSSASFPKLSSLKHFLVDTLKPGGKQQQQQIAKKPKSLSIISGITSNFNPLSSKSSKSTSDVENGASNTTPKLLVDGVPVSQGQQTSSKDQKPEAAKLITDKNEPVEQEPQLTPAFSDYDVSPAAGFFSNINSFFSFSTSATQGLSPESGHDANTLSPLLTPSPTVKEAPASTQDLFDYDASSNIWDNVVKSYALDDRRIFQDVSIPETIVSTEFRSSTQYSLYVIHYEALYFSEEGKSIIRSGTVRRRYREFTNLQSRLENQIAYKQFMKKIRGPKRWPSLPFKSLDKDTVEGRRLFLEKYLKDLIEIEAICNGPDIREFLAYEGDSHIAFVKKSPEINVPRLDKMLIRGVSGVVDRIKAIPNNAHEVISGLRSRETPDDRPGGKTVPQCDADRFEIHHQFAGQETVDGTSNMLWASCANTMEDSCSEGEEDLFNISKVLADQKTTDKMEEVYRQEVEKILASLPGSGETSTDSSDNSNMTQGQESLGLAVLDLLVQGLHGTDHWLGHDRVVQSLQAVLGKALNRYLESSISNLVSQEQVAFYLLTLRETVWPQGQLWTENTSSSTAPPPSSMPGPPADAGCKGDDRSSKSCDDDQDQTEEERRRSEVRARAGRAVGSMIPDSVKLAIGKPEFENLIDVFLGSLQNETLNRNLLYQILDQLLEDLFPEVATFDLIHNLLFSALSPSLTMPRLIKEAEKL
ncbi:sorting nexin-19 [Plakobranchus ocellatus]|uniref:Sorting nexin-19 n=1 Tax=Plakobranchus ocellatus TaxID=259542 RepID=A0AAV4DPR3_9GAST|nr:sorting nexin-19 [Plakobranchus ocellatus]